MFLENKKIKEPTRLKKTVIIQNPKNKVFYLTLYRKKKYLYEITKNCTICGHGMFI